MPRASAFVLLRAMAWMLPWPGTAPKEGEAMSQAGVGTVVEKLLTDENLRIRFALDRIDTIAELCLRGVDLTRDEVDLFCRTNAGLWFLGDEVTAEWQV
jgi:hypothetical protein